MRNARTLVLARRFICLPLFHLPSPIPAFLVPRKLSTLPSGEAVYRAALSCRKVTAALSAEVDSLASRVKGLKLRGSRGQAHERPRWAQATSGSLTR